MIEKHSSRDSCWILRWKVQCSLEDLNIKPKTVKAQGKKKKKIAASLNTVEDRGSLVCAQSMGQKCEI